MFRHGQHVLLNEDVIADGAGGMQIVPAYLSQLPLAAREDAEPGNCRVLMDEAIKMIPPGFSPWAEAQIEAYIHAHDVRVNCAAQRTYRLGIDAKLKAGERPNYLSVHALRCMYFKHTTVVEKRLTAGGWAWMLRADVLWDGTSLLHQ